MDDPEYIVLVALDTPSRETGIYISGGVMAAPTVGAVMERILPYLGVGRNWTEEDAAGREVVLEDYTGMTPEQVEAALKKQGLCFRSVGQEETVTAQIPLPGSAVPGDSEILLYFGSETQAQQLSVPDFIGMDRQAASDGAVELGLYILVTGNPGKESSVTVAEQSILPGTTVPIGTTVELKFIDTKATG
jgi:stage V sporulation protein D (sporulation-specific penicillin-binding protein)